MRSEALVNVVLAKFSGTKEEDDKERFEDVLGLLVKDLQRQSDDFKRLSRMANDWVGILQKMQGEVESSDFDSRFMASRLYNLMTRYTLSLDNNSKDSADTARTIRSLIGKYE